MMKWHTALDLFAGAGGLTEGLKQARFRVVGAIEIDPLSVTTYSRNHQNVRIWKEDITAVTVAEVRRELDLSVGELDLLAGCPPCQGFSPLRTRNGKNRNCDPRNALLSEFLRFVRGLRPRAVMLENVPRLLQYHLFSHFLAELRRLGYQVDRKVLDAADYGVAQRRRRLVVIGLLRAGLPCFASPEPERVTLRKVLASLPKPGRSGDPLHDISEHRTTRIRQLIAGIPRNGGSRSSIPRSRQLDCHRRCVGFHDVYGRMAWDDIAPTITGGCINPSKGRFLHPSQCRAITLREAAIIQSFPSDYYFSLDEGKYRAAELIGNAFPPLFARSLAVEIRRSLTYSKV